MEALKKMPEDAQKELLAYANSIGGDAAACPATAEPAAEAAASATPAKPPKQDLLAAMNELGDIAAGARANVDKMAAKSEELGQRHVRQRRKSREMEQDIFGMHLTDVIELRKSFDEIDLDGSGFVDRSELLVALQKTGKAPTEPELDFILGRFGTLPATLESENAKVSAEIKVWLKGKIDFDDFTKNCTDEQRKLIAQRYITFDDFQKMIADWEQVMQGITRKEKPSSR